MGTSVIVFTIKMVKKEKMGLHSFNLEKGGNAYNYINPIKSLLGFFFLSLPISFVFQLRQRPFHDQTLVRLLKLLVPFLSNPVSVKNPKSIYPETSTLSI